MKKKNETGDAKKEIRPGKRYRGSAIMGPAGDFLFTPYDESGKSSPWRVIDATQYATLRETNEVVQLRLTVPKCISNDVFRTMREIAFRVLVR